MSPKQQAFIKHYVASKNGAEAARLAGYSERTARTQAAQILARPDVKAAVSKEFEKQSKHIDISAEGIIRAIADIAGDASAKNCDRLRALELLGKYRKLFTDVVHNTVEAQVTTVSAEQVAAAMDAMDRKF